MFSVFRLEDGWVDCRWPIIDDIVDDISEKCRDITGDIEVNRCYRTADDRACEIYAGKDSHFVIMNITIL